MTDTSSLDPELRAQVDTLIHKWVTGGFAPADDIIAWTLDYIEDPPDFDALETYVVQATHAAIAAHCEAQKNWPAVTDCDRLDAAFDRLEAEGIVARQHFSCCLTDGHNEMWLEVRETQKERSVRGYVFYHGQDTESVVETGKLYLAYGAVEKGEAAERAVGQRIVAGLREAGFTVEWNGSVKQRILITGLDWKKRRKEGC